MSHTITVRLTKDLAEWLERTAEATGQSQGRIVRDQLTRAKAGAAGRGFMRLAGTVRGARDLSSRKGFSKT
jgi:predicted transcriptional regulator